MKKINIKKTFSAFMFATMVFLATSMVYAASGSYTSTYQFSGGLYSKSIDVGANSSFVVETWPTKGNPGSTMDLYLQRSTTFGWKEVSKSYNSSTDHDIAHLYGVDSGLHRIYFRQYTGITFTGDVKISWSY